MTTERFRLANIYLQQADTARQLSDIEGAVGHFTEAIELYKRMAHEEPDCYELVADTIEKVAATYKAAGQLEKAKETFAEAAQLREAIIKRKASESEGDES